MGQFSGVNPGQNSDVINTVTPSRVQAVEFSFAIWRNDIGDPIYRVYDWELQWTNVRESYHLTPIWRLWAGQAGGAWLPTGAVEVPAVPEALKWHHVSLRGEIRDDASIAGGRGIRYVSFSVDGTWYPIHRTFTPVIDGMADKEDIAQVHVQLDGPASISTIGGYDVLVDGLEVRYYPEGPWTTTCPRQPDEAAQLFGGSAAYWSRLADTPNGWKYNLEADSVAPPIRNGYIPELMQADWWDGLTAHLGVVGEARMPYATIATVWCPDWRYRTYLPLLLR